MINTDKAYIFGLIIGGGIFGNNEDVFFIRLPFNKRGSYEKNPQRAGEIARDILKTVNNTFRAVYNIAVQYETSTGGTWRILCEGDIATLKADLASYGINCNGELRKNTNITRLVDALIDDNLKRRFIAGLADTVGSTAKSHRRFTDDVQILSFEITGFNFDFVCSLCKLLYSVNCIPDQILWNHPNFHSANNPYYKQWKKGFKLRIKLAQYAKFGAFAFRTKAESSKENRNLQHQTNITALCPKRRINVTSTCVHPAENDVCLPASIRWGHYIHFCHVCSVLGCEHAPSDKIVAEFSRIGELINPFPILCKDTLENIEQIIESQPLLASRKYTDLNISILSLFERFKVDKKMHLYSTVVGGGYLVADVLQAIAYIIADDSELTGKRPKGYEKIIQTHITANPDLKVSIRKPDLLTPVILYGNNRAAMVGPENPNVYAKLVTVAPDNNFKLCIRDITEEDLR